MIIPSYVSKILCCILNTLATSAFREQFLMEFIMADINYAADIKISMSRTCGNVCLLVSMRRGNVACFALAFSAPGLASLLLSPQLPFSLYLPLHRLSYLSMSLIACRLVHTTRYLCIDNVIIVCKLQ